MVSLQHSSVSRSTNGERDPGRSADADRESAHATYHAIADDTLVEIAGTGGRSVDQLRAMYDRHRVTDPDREPDLRCELTDDEPDPDVVLGWPENYYGRDGDRFVVGRPNGFLAADPDWGRVSVSPDWEPYNTVYLVEFEVRRRLAQSGWALLHGCGFRFGGETVLCPSLRGAGKTNALLSVLRAGGAYLSDDRVWVRGDGTVRGYPIPINPHTEQYLSFPELTAPDRSLRDRALDRLDDHVDPTRSVVDKGVSFLRHRLFGDDGRSFRDIDDLLPEAAYVSEADTDRVTLLRAAPRRSEIAVEEISDHALAGALEMIHHYEWNDLLSEYFLAFDALFPERDRSGQLDRVRATEQAVFDELLDGVRTDLFEVPRERDWDGAGISDDLVSSLEARS